MQGNRRDAIEKCFLWWWLEFASDERLVAKLVVIEFAFAFMRKAIRRIWPAAIAQESDFLLLLRSDESSLL